MFTGSDGTIVGNTTNPVAGPSVAVNGTPATLTANGDTTLTFASRVQHVVIQNNTTTDKNFEFNAAASLGSLLIPTGTLMEFDVPCTTLHVWSTAADTVNGTAAGNFVVRGWA